MNEDDQLLDDNTILVPNTQMPSPLTFSTQMVRRFHLKSFTNQRGDAANPNNNTLTTISVYTTKLWCPLKRLIRLAWQNI